MGSLAGDSSTPGIAPQRKPFFSQIKTLYAGDVAGFVRVYAGLKFMAAGSCFIMHSSCETLVLALNNVSENLIVM